VLKCYTLSSVCELYQHQIYREVRLHSTLQHENIVRLYAAFKVRRAAAGPRRPRLRLRRGRGKGRHHSPSRRQQPGRSEPAACSPRPALPHCFLVPNPACPTASWSLTRPAAPPPTPHPPRRETAS
jgi:hypothetical protein